MAEIRSCLLDWPARAPHRLAAVVFATWSPRARRGTADFLAAASASPRRRTPRPALCAQRPGSLLTCPTVATWHRASCLSCGWSPSARSTPRPRWPRRWAASADERCRCIAGCSAPAPGRLVTGRIFTLLGRGPSRSTAAGAPGAILGHLVPSLATALGSSGDRPAALAELMGIIVTTAAPARAAHDTVKRLARATPYESAFAIRPAEGDPVMAPEVARAARALSDVVEGGTRRLAGAFKLADGSELALGGKTAPATTASWCADAPVCAQPHRHLRVPTGPAPLRHADRLRDRPRGGEPPLHLGLAGTDPEVDGALADPHLEPAGACSAWRRRPCPEAALQPVTAG